MSGVNRSRGRVVAADTPATPQRDTAVCQAATAVGAMRSPVTLSDEAVGVDAW